MWQVPSWAIGVGIIILATSLGKAIVPLLRGMGPTDRAAGRGLTETEMAQVRETLDDVQKRIGELEERQDFTERLLAKQRDAEQRLGGAS